MGCIVHTWDETVQVKVKRLKAVRASSTTVHMQGDPAFHQGPYPLVQVYIWWVLYAMGMLFLDAPDVVHSFRIHEGYPARICKGPHGGQQLLNKCGRLLLTPCAAPTVQCHFLLCDVLLYYPVRWCYSGLCQLSPFSYSKVRQVRFVPEEDRCVDNLDMNVPYSGWASEVQPSENRRIKCHTSKHTCISHGSSICLTLEIPVPE